MVKATQSDKQIVISILTKSFNNNKSVNAIIPQDGKRSQRMKRLMEYAFNVCMLQGDVWLTEDKRGCALLVKPDKKKLSLQSVLFDIQFSIRCLGINNTTKAMRREAAINKVHPTGPLYYLWFIGVDPEHQQNGIGSLLMKEILAEAVRQNRTICLETSTARNIPFYKQFGFTIFRELDFG